MTAGAIDPTRRFGPMARLVVWFAAVVLLLQLLGATQHRHDLAHQVSDCAGCMLAAQPPSPPPPHVIPEVQVTQAVVQYLLVLPALVQAGRTHARATGHHSHVLSEPEMEWICWTAAILGCLFVAVAIWSHRDARRLPKKTVYFRSYTKRRHRRRKRNHK